MGITASADTVTGTCYNPAGKRFDYEDGKREESNDGYSNSNPTFFFSSRDPGVLVESWQAALPFPELIRREQVDDIVPPSVSKSTIIFRSETVIHALTTQGGETFTTTLYLAEGIAIFTRVRLRTSGFVSGPMGAVYTAKCSFNVLK